MADKNPMMTNRETQVLLELVRSFVTAKTTKQDEEVTCLDPTSTGEHPLSIQGATYFPDGEDGLDMTWNAAFAWVPVPCGPRGSKAVRGKWGRKTISERNDGGWRPGVFLDEVLALLPAEPDADWFHPFKEFPRIDLELPVLLQVGRDRYEVRQAFLVYIGLYDEDFEAHFEALGRFVPSPDPHNLGPLLSPRGTR